MLRICKVDEITVTTPTRSIPIHYGDEVDCDQVIGEQDGAPYTLGMALEGREECFEDIVPIVAHVDSYDQE